MRSQITDRQKYISAHKKYGELNDLLSNLQSKLSDVSKDVDREFLASYRVHMLGIQSEIKTLSEEVEKGVQALKSDQTIAKLEEEVTWFVEECTRLKMNYSTMGNDFKQMQSRYNAMKEQKAYLSKQLKATMKINRVLQAEVDYLCRSNKLDGKQYLKEKFEDGMINTDEFHSYDKELEAEEDIDEEEEEEDDDDKISIDNADIPKVPDIISSSYQEYLLDQQRSDKIPLSTNYFIPATSTLPKPNPSRSSSPKNKTTTGSMNSAAKVDSKVNLNNSVISRDCHPKYAGEENTKAALSALKLSSTLDYHRRQEDKCISHPLIRNTQHHHKKQLDIFLQKKSLAEACLEKSISAVFEEVKARKLASAKHGTVKRYQDIESSHSVLMNKYGKESAPSSSSNNNQRLDQEVELLNQSLIQLSGGISGLGTNQLSDNDRFSCIVKYLLHHDRFKEVVQRIISQTAGHT